MGVGGVDRVQDWPEVTMVAGLAGQKRWTKAGLTVAELRQRLQRVGDLGRSGSALTAAERDFLAHSAEVLRRQVERFNGSVPETLQVELSPHLARWLAGAVVERP